MDQNEPQELRYWHKDKPLPDGWVFINTAGGHHTINGYIIIAKKGKTDDDH